MGFVGGLLVGALGTWYLMENPEAKAQIISINVSYTHLTLPTNREV